MAKHKILIVDDETINIKTLRNLLKDDTQIIFTTSGLDALSQARSHIPDLILLDVIMPDINGHDVCKQLKNDPVTKDIPIIFITALNEAKDEEAGLSLGAIDYIHKPFQPKIVKLRVTNHLRLKTQHDALERLAAELSIEVSQLINSEREISHLATHDPLTGLPNRALFIDRFEGSIKSAKRTGERISIMFIDLDGFKAVNDTHGHLFGDELLKFVASNLHQNVREMDTVARFGGDEFVILLPNIQNDDPLEEKIAHKILAIVNEPFNHEGKRAQLSASIGIAHYPDHGDNLNMLLVAADEAMYRAKKDGKNNAVFARNHN
jgi:diguanylate cyclase (GGDEF)-like protein